MKKFYFIFSLLICFALSTEQLWGADTAVETINMIGFGGQTGSSYVNVTVEGASEESSIAMVAYAFNPTSGQVRGGKTTTVGASVTTADNSANWSLYNSAGMPGAITAIKVTQTATGTNKFQNTLYVALGDGTQGWVTKLTDQTNLQAQDNGATATEINFTIDATKEYKYFKLFSTAKFTTGTVAGVKVEVTYEVPATPAKTLSSIAVSGTPTTTSYYVGDDFDPAGLVVTGTYSDNSQAAIISGITWAYNPSQTLTLNQTTIGVTATVSEIASSEYSVEGLTVTEAPAADNYELVTNVANLADGAEIIIVNIDEDKALSTTQATNNRSGVAVSSTDHVIAVGDDVQIITLEASSTAWKFNVGGSKYLYAASSSANQLKSAADATAGTNGVWSIAIASDGAATIIAQGSNTRNNLRYNPNGGSPIFCSYASSSNLGLVKIFKKSDGSTSKTAAGLAFDAADAQKLVKVGGSLSTPALTNPNSLTATYSSSDASVAEVNASTGAITIKNKAGKAVITASSEETDDYNAGSASYTIYVTDHAGTEADPYSAADAKIVIDGFETKEGVYVSGIVSSIVTAYNSQYGNISFNISADGSVNGQQVQAYRCKSFNSANFTSADDVVAGATVVVTGNLKKHSSTYELDADCYLVSYEAPETPKTDISNTKATAYTVAEALALAADNNSDLTKSVYIKGVVYKADSYNSTNGTYNIYVCDEGKTEDDGKFEFFKCTGIREDGANATTKFAEGDVQVGDKVIGYGVMTYFQNGSIWELNTGNYLVELVRPEVAVTGVTLTGTATVEVGSTVTLTATVAPENASNKNITWSVVSGSDKASVADGVVTGVAAGTAVIRATSEADNTKYAECTVTVNAVNPNAKKVTFDATSDIASDNAEGVTKSGITIKTTHVDGVNDQSTAISYYQTFKNATLNVSSTVGNITKIELTCESSHPASGFGEAYTNGVWTGNAAEVELTASVKQVRINTIVVTYKEDNRTEAGLAWNPASDIELTVGEAFNAPSLTNPHGVTVSVESDNTELATVSSGVVSLVADATGTATITATFAGDDDYKPATVSYTITVNSATPVATGDTYTKVTSNADLTAGEYILVYEGESETLVWNGKDAADGKVSATISNNAIAIPEGAVSLTIATVDGGYSILINGGDNNGKYVGQTSDANGMSIGETAHANSISIDADGNAVIVSGGAYLRYNASNNQNRFRYYKSSSYTGQKAIQLYKKASAIPELNWTDARTGLTEGNYYTICYPKAMTAIRGGLLFSLGGLETNSVYLVQEDAPFVAGRPYILYANDVKLEAIVEGDDAPAGSYHGLYGTLSAMDATDLSNAGATYMLYNNSIRLIGNNNSLAAGRAYIILNEIPGGAPSGQAPGRVRRMPMQGNVATDIEANGLIDKPTKVMIDGQLFILRNESMYDMTGRLVK